MNKLTRILVFGGLGLVGYYILMRKKNVSTDLSDLPESGMEDKPGEGLKIDQSNGQTGFEQTGNGGTGWKFIYISKVTPLYVLRAGELLRKVLEKVSHRPPLNVGRNMTYHVIAENSEAYKVGDQSYLLKNDIPQKDIFFIAEDEAVDVDLPTSVYRKNFIGGFSLTGEKLEPGSSVLIGRIEDNYIKIKGTDRWVSVPYLFRVKRTQTL